MWNIFRYNQLQMKVNFIELLIITHFLDMYILITEEVYGTPCVKSSRD